MTQEQIAAILLRRDRSEDDIEEIDALITNGTTTDQARIEEAIARAKAGADGWADCVVLLTPP